MKSVVRISGIVLLSANIALAQDPAPPKPVYPGTDAAKLAPRTALVVGVASTVPETGFLPLGNPVNDAIAITKGLREVHFSVFAPNESYTPEQMTRQTIKRALYDFALTLKTVGGVGLIYFSGHGIQHDGQMYLVPYDMYVRYDRDLDEDMIPVGLFYEAFKYAGNKLNFLIIDACRNNPWDKSLEVFGSARKVAQLTDDLNSVIRATATMSGSKALDGSGTLSPYAHVFVDSLKEPDRNVFGFFNEGIAEGLAPLVEKVQTPTVQYAGAHDFVFRPTIISFNQEMEIYKSAVATGNRKLYEKLTTTYAGGYFYRVAQEALDHGQLAPASDTQIIEVSKPNSINVHAAQSKTSAVVDIKRRGDPLRRAEGVEDAKTSKWVSVMISEGTAPAFVERASVQIAPLAATTYEMAFRPGPLAGTEVLTPESAAKVASVAKAAKAVGVSRMEIVSYAQGSGGKEPGFDQQVVVREASVLQALKEEGFDASKAILTVKDASDATRVGAVEVILSVPAGRR